MDKLEATEGQDSALMSKSGSVSTSYQSSRVLYPCSVQCFPNSTSEESMSTDRVSTFQGHGAGLWGARAGVPPSCV